MPAPPPPPPDPAGVKKVRSSLTLLMALAATTVAIGIVVELKPVVFEAGAQEVVVVDTIGIATPEAAAYLVEGQAGEMLVQVVGRLRQLGRRIVDVGQQQAVLDVAARIDDDEQDALFRQAQEFYLLERRFAPRALHHAGELRQRGQHLGRVGDHALRLVGLQRRGVHAHQAGLGGDQQPCGRDEGKGALHGRWASGGMVQRTLGDCVGVGQGGTQVWPRFPTGSVFSLGRSHGASVVSSHRKIGVRIQPPS